MSLGVDNIMNCVLITNKSKTKMETVQTVEVPRRVNIVIKAKPNVLMFLMSP